MVRGDKARRVGFAAGLPLDFLAAGFRGDFDFPRRFIPRRPFRYSVGFASVAVGGGRSGSGAPYCFTMRKRHRRTAASSFSNGSLRYTEVPRAVKDAESKPDSANDAYRRLASFTNRCVVGPFVSIVRPYSLGFRLQ